MQDLVTRRGFAVTALRAAELVLVEQPFAPAVVQALTIVGEVFSPLRLRLFGHDGAGRVAADTVIAEVGGSGDRHASDHPPADDFCVLNNDAGEHLPMARLTTGESVPAFGTGSTAGVGVAALCIPMTTAGKPTGLLVADQPFGSGRIDVAWLDLIIEILTSLMIFVSAAHARESAEKRLRAAADELARAKRATDLLLSRAAHELRTPLVALTSIVRLLEDRGDVMTADRRAEALTHVRRSGERLAQLVERTLFLVRVDAAQDNPPVEVVDFGRLSAAAQSLAYGLTLGGSVEFEVCNRLPAGYRFLGDESALSAIIENLVGNACKFSHQGIVRLCFVASVPGLLTLSVSDEGVGIDPEYTIDLDRPFHRSSAGVHGEQGAGLGLSIVSALVRKSAGRFTIEPGQNGGTIATVAIPNGR